MIIQGQKDLYNPENVVISCLGLAKNLDGEINVQKAEILKTINGEVGKLIVKTQDGFTILNKKNIKFIIGKRKNELLDKENYKLEEVKVSFSDGETIRGKILISKFESRISDYIMEEKENFIIFIPEEEEKLVYYINISTQGPLVSIGK